MMFLAGLLCFFVPKVESFLKFTQGELPGLTVLVLNVSAELRAMWFPWALASMAAIAGLAILAWRWRSAVPCVLAVLLLLLTASAIFVVYYAIGVLPIPALAQKIRETGCGDLRQPSKELSPGAVGRAYLCDNSPGRAPRESELREMSTEERSSR
jgi:hypothetical protein